MKSWERFDIFPLTAYHRQLAELSTPRRSTPMALPDGSFTFGVGRTALSEMEIDLLLYNDLQGLRCRLLAELPWVLRLDPARFAVVLELARLWGLESLKQHSRFTYELEVDNYDTAGTLLADSAWALRHPRQAVTLVQMIVTGEWPFEEDTAEGPAAFPLTFSLPPSGPSR